MKFIVAYRFSFDAIFGTSFMNIHLDETMCREQNIKIHLNLKVQWNNEGPISEGSDAAALVKTKTIVFTDVAGPGYHLTPRRIVITVHILCTQRGGGS